MCYPKPGPRCSAHAATKVAEARRVAYVYLQNNKADGTKKTLYDSKFEKLIKRIHEAEAEYALTPAGIKEQERYIAGHPDDERATQKLEESKTLRQARLEAVKHLKPVTHRKVKPEFQYSRTELSKDGDYLEAMGDHTEDITTMLKESRVWAEKLTDDEIETVQWYTRNGYADINGHLSNPNYTPFYGAIDKDVTEAAIKNLDSALDKSAFNRDVILYRRHFVYQDSGYTKPITLEEQQALFSVGSVYKPNFYMSTSMDPDNAPPDNGNVIFLEIKARKAAAVSALASSGTQEKEYLLPRTGQYKVVSNTPKVTVTGLTGKPRTLTVIQLEEI